MNYLLSNAGLRRCLVMTIALLQLSGCALFQGPKLDKNGDWSFNGKMAIRNTTEASSFNVSWLQQGEYYQIVLSGPLGQGEMTIKGHPGDVTLVSGNDTYYASSLNQLIFELTGLELPLEYLPYWVRAKAMPGESSTVLMNEAGQINSIEQSGWTVSYNDYFADEPVLPKKLAFERAQDSGKLVIREWHTKSTK